MRGSKGLADTDDDDGFNYAEASPDVIDLILPLENSSLFAEAGDTVITVTDESGVFGGSCSVKVVGRDSPTTWSRRNSDSIELAIGQVLPDGQHDYLVATYPAQHCLISGHVIGRTELSVNRHDISTLVPGKELNDAVLSAFFALLSSRDELLVYKKRKLGIVSNRRYRECAIFSSFFLSTLENRQSVEHLRFVRGHITCGCGKLLPEFSNLFSRLESL